ncbi:hypothetical protein J5J10_14205 [Ciceribacter sp. L1K23]|uniref:plasmid mobilization protein n=1 Tax=unclassified Ciceribacter TaxID=2628820 RepID=UPI001ABE99C7|nr:MULTISPECIES: hypothetical protein [unclassified Ciceribacter]MBO3759016.1 hypothetical protein [Ciceribacter sp. L1K22]MBR0556837.1 hypothetical protein [Ciceribacter sp. L1K23]
MKKQMTIEMTEEMRAALEQQAADAGLSLQAYLSDMVITRAAREPDASAPVDGESPDAPNDARTQ